VVVYGPALWQRAAFWLFGSAQAVGFASLKFESQQTGCQACQGPTERVEDSGFVVLPVGIIEAVQ
jgi:hypothetical protein